MIGKEVLNYTIVQSIGKGGMGSVFKAVHKQIPALSAAVKVLHPALFYNETLKKKFYQEASVLARMDHTNIVRLLDFTEDNQGVYLLMEYIKGRSLNQMIRNETGPIREDRVIKIFNKILEAFRYAHSQTPAIVHRDIKPSNILIMESDEPKIIDFGIVKLLEDEQQPGATQTGSRIGTPVFMSPEQILGKHVDRRTDIYSLGITLFHMVTGTSPYHSTLSDFEIQSKIVNEPLPDPRTIYPGVSAHICEVIKKAASRNKEERYQDCTEFAKHLNNKSRISYFESNTNQVNAGQPVMIRWGADSKSPVSISGVGENMSPTGERTIYPVSDTMITIKAGDETKSIMIKVLPIQIKRASGVSFIVIIFIIIGVLFVLLLFIGIAGS